MSKQKSILIQKKYMTARFGVLKTHILLCLYRHNFSKRLQNYINNVNNKHNRNRIEYMKIIYNYFFCNQDIYNNVLYTNFVEISKEKLFEFSISYPEDFVPILEKFGYICNYTTNTRDKCHTKCDNFVCETHQKLSILIKDEIKNHLDLAQLPKVLTNIVLLYVFPVY